MPEGTSNQLLRDTMVRRQIYLQRYSATLSRDITALLDDTEKQVRDTIERRLAVLEGKDFSATTNSRLNVLANALEKLRRDAFNGANEMWDDHMQALAVAEAEFLDSAIKDVSPVVLDTTMPDPVHLGSIVSTQPMQGHLLEDWASGLASKDVDRMMASVRTGIAQGSTTDEIVRGILGSASMDGADGILEMTRKDIRSITHTAVQTVAGEARQAYAEANSDIIPQEQYVATLDSRTTLECAALDGTLFDVGEGEQPPIHWNSFPGECILSFGTKGITALAQHWFQGNLAVFRTSSGHEFSCTPGHLILTNCGWVAACLLNKGDCIVRDLRPQRPLGIKQPECENSPTAAEDVFHTLSKKDGWSRHIQSVTTYDFHGDVIDGKVCVVAPDGSLGSQQETSDFTRRLECALVSTVMRPPPLSCLFGEGDVSHVGVAVVASSNGSVCSSGFSSALDRRHALEDEFVRSAAGSENATSFQQAFDGGAVNGKFCGNVSGSSGPIDVSPNYIVRIGQLDRSAHQSIGVDDSHNRLPIPLDVFCDLFGCQSGEIEFSDLVFVGRRYFAGHVYCPSTEEGYFSTDGGFVSSNCRSVRVPILDGAAIGDRPATSAFEDDLAGLDKEERAARVSELTGRVPGTTTYQAFLGRQTNAFQEEVLGTQRAALFRDGGLTLDRFTDRKNQPYTLNQLRTREPEAFQRIRSK